MHECKMMKWFREPMLGYFSSKCNVVYMLTYIIDVMLCFITCCFRSTDVCIECAGEVDHGSKSGTQYWNLCKYPCFPRSCLYKETWTSLLCVYFMNMACMCVIKLVKCSCY